MHEILSFVKVCTTELIHLCTTSNICRCGPRLLRPLCSSDQDPGDEHPGEAAGAREQGGGGAQQAGPSQEAALQDICGWERGAVGIDNIRDQDRRRNERSNHVKTFMFAEQMAIINNVAKSF